MTREEIAESLKLLKEQAQKSHNDTAILNVKIESFEWVMESAIKALSQEPCEDATKHEYDTFCSHKCEKCVDAECPLRRDDAISRKKAICVISACDGKSAQIEALEQLPPVTQKGDVKNV